MGKRQKMHNLEGFGDEAYMWIPPNPEGHVTVTARKGKTFINVFMPGAKLAQRIAKLALAHAP
jgi:hypothetical protein